MSEETTTIEITTQQRHYLRDINPSSAKAALGEIIEDHDTGGVDAEEIVSELKNELSMANEPAVEVDVERLYARIDELESRLPAKVGDEVEGRLR